ncbi:hypothetical protein U9M48_019017 [Paspalum notatum var. saurae]|uniref:Uncharacterized protein n=1 Tax=Paspalum notatum var. saurae TaxID=547442 RepID=A0AAQ3TE25_PASNO
MKRNPSESSTKSKEQHDEEPLTSTKCNGVTTPKKRQLGSKMNSCKQNILPKPCNAGIEKVVDHEILNNIGIKLLM